MTDRPMDPEVLAYLRPLGMWPPSQVPKLLSAHDHWHRLAIRLRAALELSERTGASTLLMLRDEQATLAATLESWEECECDERQCPGVRPKREHSLNTPCCDAPVLTRPAAELWYQDEQARCPDCGDRATVEVSEGFGDGEPSVATLSMAGEPEGEL